MKVNKDNIECMIGKCFKNEDEDGFAKIVELLNKEVFGEFDEHLKNTLSQSL